MKFIFLFFLLESIGNLIIIIDLYIGGKHKAIIENDYKFNNEIFVLFLKKNFFSRSPVEN